MRVPHRDTSLAVRRYTGCYSFLLLLFVICSVARGELTSGRIRGDDEPQLVSWRVLEGITEPFQSSAESTIPVWKQMKSSADQKATDQAIQQALHEYGQLIRHPYLFGEMPSEEKYDVFISMAKLLMTMGFHQKAEVLLYEAMSYTKDAYEAHLQLGLLSLDREDIDKAKVHFKNCLYYQESDVYILTYLSMVLLAEGKTHEAKFFLSRIVSILQSKVQKLSFLLSDAEMKATTAPIPFQKLSVWFEDTLTKVFYGDFRVTPTASVESLRYFANLYNWVAAEELTGRYVFDLGQALYEGGRAVVGLEMMRRGGQSSDPSSDGPVSHMIVQLRLAFEIPLVPSSVSDLLVSYLRMTGYLAETADDFEVVSVSNLLDMSWPLPLLGASGLRTAPVIRELLWRFDNGRAIDSIGAAHWQSYLSNSHVVPAAIIQWTRHFLQYPQHLLRNISSTFVSENLPLKLETEKVDNSMVTVQVGILGGHFNDHAVGLTVLHRILSLIDDQFCSIWTQQQSQPNNKARKPKLSFTLLSLPLLPDRFTQQIASKVQRVVNIPNEPLRAQDTIAALGIDVMLFFDDQPFPDQAVLALQNLRLAPVQICVFVRGISCATSAMDYYLLPAELDSVAETAWTSTHAAWKNVFAEQIVRVQWPLVSAAALDAHLTLLRGESTSSDNAQSTTASSSVSSIKGSHGSTGSVGTSVGSSSVFGGNSISNIGNNLRFVPSQAEGQIFFDGQPVALLVVSPQQLHPLMDDTLVRILRAVPTLHLVIAIPQDFFPHLSGDSNNNNNNNKNGDEGQADKRRMAWARSLVRRLWTRAGVSLYMRIRLLPRPLSTRRLWQLMKQVDVVLDTFPLGLSATRLSLALSVGTPVVTFQSGIVLSTPRDDLQELRHRLMQQHHHHNNNQPPEKHHPVAAYLAQHDVPWLPTMSQLAGFYSRCSSKGLSEALVASSMLHYAQLAIRLLNNREYSYELRVQLLEALDYDAAIGDLGSNEITKRSSSALSNSDNFASTNTETLYSSNELIGNRFCEDNDLARFLFRAGIPFAESRHGFLQREISLLQSSSSSNSNNNNAAMDWKEQMKPPKLAHQPSEIGGISPGFKSNEAPEASTLNTRSNKNNNWNVLKVFGVGQ